MVQFATGTAARRLCNLASDSPRQEIPTDASPVYDSAQVGSPAIEEGRELWRYRNLVAQMVRRDIVARYKRSVLGVAWTLLNPLGTMVVLAVVFSQVFKTDHTFPAYLLSGQLVWLFFSTATSEAMINLIGGINLLQRIYMPRTIFAATAIGTGLFNMVISLIPLVLVMLVVGVPLTPAALFLPVPIFLLSCFTFGMGLLLSTMAVYFRDVVAMYQVVLTAWMYLTPIIYPEELLNPVFRLWLSRLNPMYVIVRLFRIPIYEGRLPVWGEFWPAAFASIVILALGWYVFSKKANEFAYRI